MPFLALPSFSLQAGRDNEDDDEAVHCSSSSAHEIKVNTRQWNEDLSGDNE